MIGLEDRQTLVQHIETAHTAGARLRPACAVAGISVRTFERWQANDGLAVGDRRPEATRPMPAHALGASQDSCRLIHATNRVLFSARTWSRMTASRSGFSVTAPIGDQLRVFFDQRAGLPSRAWR